MAEQISLGEHMIRTREFAQSLLDKMPEISNTIHTLIKIKKQRMKHTWNPINGEGAESVEELNDETSAGDGGFGLSSLPIR